MIPKLLQENSFKISLPKYEFHKSSLIYLGYNISSDGLSLPTEKRSEISNYLFLETQQYLDVFLKRNDWIIQTFYFTFCQNYFFHFQKRPDQFHVWIPEDKEAFIEIKNQFQSATILPFSLPMQLTFNLLQIADKLLSEQLSINWLMDKHCRQIFKAKTYLNNIENTLDSTKNFKHLLLCFAFQTFVRRWAVILCIDHKSFVSAILQQEFRKEKLTTTSSYSFNRIHLFNELHQMRDNIMADVFSRISQVKVNAIDLPSIERLQSTEEEIISFHNSSFSSYDSLELHVCPHVFLRVYRIYKSLEAPYSGSFKILKRMD